MDKHHIVLTILVLLLNTNVGAVPVTFEFSGTVIDYHNIEGILDPAIGIGSTFTGSYTFNSDAVDSDTDPRYGHYIYSESAPSGFSMIVMLESEVFQSISSSNAIYTENEVDFDNYFVAGRFDEGPDIDGATMSLDLKGGPTLLDSDALPLTPPLLERATLWTWFDLIYMPEPLSEEQGWDISGTISTLTLVPEPATLLFLGFGALALIRRRRP